MVRRMLSACAQKRASDIHLTHKANLIKSFFVHSASLYHGLVSDVPDFIDCFLHLTCWVVGCCGMLCLRYIGKHPNYGLGLDLVTPIGEMAWVRGWMCSSFTTTLRILKMHSCDHQWTLWTEPLTEVQEKAVEKPFEVGHVCMFCYKKANQGVSKSQRFWKVW